MLLVLARASLEAVTFTGRWGGHHHTCSIRDFEVLENIRVHSGYWLKYKDSYECDNDREFSRGWYDDTERLVGLLPASVKSVGIEGEVDKVDVTTLLRELPERRAEFVPCLKSINFMDYSPKRILLVHWQDFYWRQNFDNLASIYCCDVCSRSRRMSSLLLALH